MSPVSKAGIKAREKYNSSKYDDLRVRVPKGIKEKIQIHAKKCGESLNSFINRAANETIERDNEKINNR